MQNEEHRAPVREFIRNLRLAIGRYLDTKSADVEHREVIKELYSAGDRTAGRTGKTADTDCVQTA